MQERQHRDFLRRDHRQRQQDRAGGREAAGCCRAGQVFAQSADGHDGSRNRDQCKGAGAGGNDLRRLVAASSRQKQISGDRQAAHHDQNIGEKGRARHPHIGKEAQPHQSPQTALEQFFARWKQVAYRNDGVGQLGAGRQRQDGEEGR